MSAEDRTIAVGVAGLGYWGPNLARNLAAIPGCELRWLCDAVPETRERLSRSFPEARLTGDLEDLLADESLDAVVLATPVPTHAELACAVLEAGKDCFVEKPLATTAADAERAVAAAERCGRTLMVGHLLEYHPAVESLRELIAEAVDLIVSIAKAPNEPGRLVQEVVSINGIVDGTYQLSNAE